MQRSIKILSLLLCLVLLVGFAACGNEGGKEDNGKISIVCTLFPQYGFASNKGYGSAEHIAAIKEYGPTPIHRKSFIKNFLQKIVIKEGHVMQISELAKQYVGTTSSSEAMTGTRGIEKLQPQIYQQLNIYYRVFLSCVQKRK